MYAFKNEILEWELEGYERLKALFLELVSLYVFVIYFFVKIGFRLLRAVVYFFFARPRLIQQIEPGRYKEVEKERFMHLVHWDR